MKRTAPDIFLLSRLSDEGEILYHWVCTKCHATGKKYSEQSLYAELLGYRHWQRYHK